MHKHGQKAGQKAECLQRLQKHKLRKLLSGTFICSR